MDCMQEWSDRVSREHIDRILELGERIMILPVEEKTFRLTLMTSQLVESGIAGSIEEAYVMLMEAYAHASNMQLMKWYEDMLLSLSSNKGGNHARSRT